MSSSLDLHPLPVVASLLLSQYRAVYVYAYQKDRWCLQADGVEMWLIEYPDGGLGLVENPF